MKGCERCLGASQAAREQIKGPTSHIIIRLQRQEEQTTTTIESMNKYILGML